MAELRPIGGGDGVGEGASLFAASCGRWGKRSRKVIDEAKGKARADLDLAEWTRQGWGFTAAAVAEPPPLGHIAHESASRLSVADFVDRYERPNLPVVISGCADAWPAVTEGAWTPAALYGAFRHRRFRCGEDDRGYPVKTKLKHFLRYAVRAAAPG